jgi:phenylacetate-coenzyme A ligase PaaK-like adenylate-forming protein
LLKAFASAARRPSWDREQKTRWILERLRAIVRRAYEDTVYYSASFSIRHQFDHYLISVREFSRLPALDREHVHEAGSKLLSSSVPPDQLRKDRTGGSTGVPTESG